MNLIPICGDCHIVFSKAEKESRTIVHRVRQPIRVVIATIEIRKPILPQTVQRGKLNDKVGNIYYVILNFVTFLLHF